MDRRLTPANDRVAHESLRGRVDAPRFVEGEVLRVAVPLVDLLARPGGPRDRQLILGDDVRVLDVDGGFAFGQSLKDGYCGYLQKDALAVLPEPTHWVAAPASHLYAGPRVQSPETGLLTMGARVAVTATEGAFAVCAQGHVPAVHLRRLLDRYDDPAAVAEMFLGTPYLWGGNSRSGLDCSGLVQLAYHACGRACPGDSDLQQAIGTPLDEGAPLRRGDLLFWKGHVAMVVDDRRLIHSNGHTMSTAHEGIAACIARVLEQGGGPVTARRRP